VLFAAGPGSLLGQWPVVRSDGTDRKQVVVGGALVLSLALLVSGLATGAIGLWIGWFLLGFGATCLVHGGEIVAVANGGRPIERTLARINLGGVAGDVAGPLLIAAGRFAGLSWRVLFLVGAIAVGSYAVWLAVSAFPPPRPVREPEEGEDRRFRTAGAGAVGVLALLAMPLDESFLAAVLAFPERERGLSPTTAALLGVAFVTGGVLTFTALPGRLARHAPHRVVACAGAVMTVAALASALVPAGLLVVAGVGFSCALSSSWLALQSVSLRLNPGREGLTKALVEAFELVGFAIPVAIAVVADRHGLRAAVLAYSALPALLGVVALAVRRSLRGGPPAHAADGAPPGGPGMMTA